MPRSEAAFIDMAVTRVPPPRPQLPASERMVRPDPRPAPPAAPALAPVVPAPVAPMPAQAGALTTGPVEPEAAQRPMPALEATPAQGASAPAPARAAPAPARLTPPPRGMAFRPPAPRAPAGPASPSREQPRDPATHAPPGPRHGEGDDGALERGATAPQLRRFIKSRAYVPMHELRRRFAINGDDDEVTPVDLERRRVFVGLPEREGRLLGELLRGGDIGFELSLDPISPIVVGVYPMRPVTRV